MEILFIQLSENDHNFEKIKLVTGFVVHGHIYQPNICAFIVLGCIL